MTHQEKDILSFQMNETYILDISDGLRDSIKKQIYSTMSDNSLTACIVFQYKTSEAMYLL